MRTNAPNAKPIGLTVIGLLGGIASGKSLVADLLVARGAVKLDADRAGHEVLRVPAVIEACLARWGNRIFGADGQVLRPVLAAIVFAPPPDGPPELAYLESITHPRIRQKLLAELDAIAAAGSASVVVLDAPVMLKSGWNALCSEIVFVDAPEDVRKARARARGWSDEEFARREATQEPLEIKRKHATQTIANGGSIEATAAQVDDLWRQWTTQTKR